MGKRLVLSIAILISCLIYFSDLAQADTITLTTYYPAPYGVYKDFQVTERAAVGDISGAGDPAIDEVSDLDQGELWVGDSVIFEPRGGAPGGWAAGKEGEVCYSTSAGELYYWNGATWRQVNF